MSRILALDYGKKRTGVAVTDELQLIASGLTTVPTESLLEFLNEYIQTEKVQLLILGQPKKLDNSDGIIEKDIVDFIAKFSTLYPHISIERIDERFTSKIAFQSMIDAGMKMKKRREKATIDKISATLILQSYLYYKT
jgi:putative Holliday junction resolvase